MTSAETKSSSLRFPRRAGLVVAMVFAFAPRLVAADVVKPAVPAAWTSAFVEASAALTFARTTTIAAARDEAIADAQACLEKFLHDEPKHDDTPLAQAQLGVVHLAAARAATSNARLFESAADQNTLANQARERIRSAQELFATAIKGIDEQFVCFWGCFAPEEVQRQRRRRGMLLQGGRTQAMMGRADALEALADTFPPESAEARANIKAAAERHAAVFKEYRWLMSGLVARLKQGDCLARLGEVDQALVVYDDVLSGPDELKPVHELRVSAMVASLKCLNSDAAKRPAAAFSRGEEYLTHLPREEASWERWQAVRYETARGYYLAAAATPRADGTAPPERAAWLAKGDAHAAQLTEQSGPFRTPAETLRREIAKIGTVGGNGTK